MGNGFSSFPPQKKASRHNQQQLPASFYFLELGPRLRGGKIRERSVCVVLCTYFPGSLKQYV